MNLYAFQLGKNPQLSLAELHAVIGKENFVDNVSKHAIFKLEQQTKESASTLLARLGGTIKISEVITTIENSSKTEDLLPILERSLEETFKEHSGKALFSINNFSCKNINIRTVLTFSKKFIKKMNLNVRFLNHDGKNPSSAAIYKSKVLNKGIDINLINGDETFITKTLAIQDISAYSFRDYKKPYRDATNGMLPPKLAQIMLNLAGKKSTVYDPFCGNGTVLLEALLMGLNAIGSDLNPDMVIASESNCNWLNEKFDIKNEYDVFYADAQFLSSKLNKEVDAIVTEGYLGPPLEKSPSENEAEKNFRTLGNLHLNWLKEAAKVLKKDQKVVTCVAAYRMNKGIKTIENFSELAELSGFEIEKKYLYHRPGQIVLREIYVLKRK